MTDKVQKIKEWISKEQDGLMDANGNFENSSDEGAFHILTNLDYYIDSLQEEPISIWHNASEEQPEEYRTVVAWHPTKMDGEVIPRCVEVYKGRIWAYIDDILNLSNIERTVKNWEEPVSDDLEEAMQHNAPNNIGIDDLLYWRNGFVACFNWQKRKDSISSKDLEELINTISKRYPEVSFAKLSRIAVRVAKWQKQQDQSTIELAEDHAMLAGMEKTKEEMMAKAIDGVVTFDYYGDGDKTYGCIAHDSFCLEDRGLKDNEEVKLVIIKDKEV